MRIRRVDKNGMKITDRGQNKEEVKVSKIKTARLSDLERKEVGGEG